MGTRHLIAVVVDGEYKVAQYGQWDGYPSGQGASLLEKLSNINIDTFRDNVRELTYISEEEYQKAWEMAGAEPNATSVTLQIADKFEDMYPHLSRNCGSHIIDHIYKWGGQIKVQNSLDFASDSLFCEYGYVIDLDKNTFEVYQGFIEAPHTGERFSDFPLMNNNVSDQYYPIKHMYTFDLVNLPTEEEFLTILDKIENVEEE